MKVIQSHNKKGYLRDSVFFFHYNKPLSKKRGKPQITIHFKKQCLIVDNIICWAETRGHISKRQPYFVMKGKTATIMIQDKVATIY